MPATNGHRGWGHIRKLPSKRFQASYIGPDLRRHTAPNTFTVKLNAEGWLANERQLIERAALTGEPWKAPELRAAEKKAEVLTLAGFAATWISHRNVKPRTKIGYQSLWDSLIADRLGPVAVAELSAPTVRAWYAGLGTKAPRRNSHAYGLLHAICATAVKDGLLVTNPCQIERAMNPSRKREPVILDINELAALADAIGERWRTLILISAWCGLRWGEVTELRRKDIGPGCETINVHRAVTHRIDELDGSRCRIDTTKSGKGRTVVVPPHIRANIKAHLDSHTGSNADALLFVPVRGGCHVNDKAFADSHLKPALKAIGRESVRFHDLRHFAGTMTARVGGSVSETMARLGHSTSKASLLYQAAVDERQAVIADALSKLATGEVSG